MDPKSILLERPMGRLQIVAVAICIALNALDGFDVLAITFAAPGLSESWKLGPGAIGIVISTGLIGMAAGSLLLAPLADIIGRRLMILASLVAMSGGMFLSATAGDVYMLSLWRVVTGLGIGAMLAAINAMTAEYANAKRRDMAVSLMAVGYPIGGVVGGSIAAWLLTHHSWHAIFVFGGAVTAVLIPIVWFLLPESIEFLIGKGKGDVLPQVNGILGRMGHPAATILPARAVDARPARVTDIFAPKMLHNTLMVSLAYFLHIMTFYYILGWVPSIVTALGFEKAVGTQVSVWVNVGGIMGGIALGWASHRFGLKPLVLGTMVCTALALMVFGQTAPDIGTLKLVAFVMGFFMFGGVVGAYAIMAKIYDSSVRATGTGFVIGVGRGGAAIGPILAGFLIQADLSRGSVALVMALGSVLGAGAIAMLRMRQHIVSNA